MKRIFLPSRELINSVAIRSTKFDPAIHVTIRLFLICREDSVHSKSYWPQPTHTSKSRQVNGIPAKLQTPVLDWPGDLWKAPLHPPHEVCMRILRHATLSETLRDLGGDVFEQILLIRPSLVSNPLYSYVHSKYFQQYTFCENNKLRLKGLICFGQEWPKNKCLC